MEIVIYLIIFFIFWIVCNYILKKLMYDNAADDLIISALKYRKTIMFVILGMLFFTFFDINILTYIGIIYCIIISILEGIMLVISLITNLDYYIKEKIFEAHMWLLVLAKTLNEIAHIIMAIALFTILN